MTTEVINETTTVIDAAEFVELADHVLTADDLLGGHCAIVRRGRRTVGGVQVGTGR